MNHVVPSFILISILRSYLFGMGEEPFIVHIHSITDTRLVCWIVMNCVIDLGFSNLPFGPIWEKGFRISRPASVAFCRVSMVTALWDRRLSIFELRVVDLCKSYKHNDDDSQHRCVFQNKNTYRRLCQSMAMERKAQHVDGRDVALDLIPLSTVVFQQEVYPES
jgi:hypothetical protein